MKRTITVILLGIFIVGLSSSLAFAKDKEIPLTATASSVHLNSPKFGPDKAVDGSDATSWAGAEGQAPWWIMFDAQQEIQISTINIKWHSRRYTPQDYDIQVSNDAENWQDLFTGLTGTYLPDGQIIEIGQQTRYLRLYIHTVPSYFPSLTEFQAFKQVNIPHLLRFQGRLRDINGVPLDGTFNITFRLYNTETEGTPLWEEVRAGEQAVEVEAGLLDVELGSVTPLNLAFDEQYWLGVEVDPDTEMTPRFKLTTVPYAFTSEE